MDVMTRRAFSGSAVYTRIMEPSAPVESCASGDIVLRKAEHQVGIAGQWTFGGARLDGAVPVDVDVEDRFAIGADKGRHPGPGLQFEDGSIENFEGALTGFTTEAELIRDNHLASLEHGLVGDAELAKELDRGGTDLQHLELVTNVTAASPVTRKADGTIHLELVLLVWILGFVNAEEGVLVAAHGDIHDETVGFDPAIAPDFQFVSVGALHAGIGLDGHMAHGI